MQCKLLLTSFFMNDIYLLFFCGGRGQGVRKNKSADHSSFLKRPIISDFYYDNESTTAAINLPGRPDYQGAWLRSRGVSRNLAVDLKHLYLGVFPVNNDSAINRSYRKIVSSKYADYSPITLTDRVNVRSSRGRFES